MPKGRSIRNSDLKALLDSSYNKQDIVGDYVLDKDISGSRNSVYHNKNTGHTVVAHRGTQGAKDWLNNLAYALGGERLYKTTHRYKDARKIQSRAEKKYGTDNLATIGHSQGGLQAEMLGRKGKETITLNKATRPLTNKKSSNQYDIRAENDLVSRLNPFQISNGNEIGIKSYSNDPLSEHNINVLERLPHNQLIGRNLKNIRFKR
jgi:hypothetical protein